MKKTKTFMSKQRIMGWDCLQRQKFKTEQSSHRNVRVSGDRLIAVKQINVGDEITLNYNKTKDVIAFPFLEK